MQIPVLVERVKGDGYRARGAEPFAVSAKGSTREEALAKLRAKIQTRLKNGTEIVGLEVGEQAHPLAEFAGMFKDDPLFEDWQKAIAEYRRQVDNDPDYL
jgi:predicted RNase H-like HicB family nuclease